MCELDVVTGLPEACRLNEVEAWLACNRARARQDLFNRFGKAGDL